MSEETYRAIHERAKANLEKMGKPDLLDILRPVTPGAAVGRSFYARFGLRLNLFSAVEADTSFDFLGKKLASPVMVAPMSDNSLSNHYPKAFKDLADAARKFGTQYWIGDCKDEVWKEVAAAAPSAVRIVKPWKDKQRILTSLKLAEDAGAFAVGMDLDSGFYNAECAPQPASALPGYVKATKLPFVAKAIGSVKSAQIARDAGAAAVMVTSHGGSLGPSCGHPLEILPEIVRAVGGDVLVLAESGLRRGEDVLKLLARGARGVLMGRGLLLGLFAGGSEGVLEVLRMLDEELKRAMVMAGCPDLKSVSGDILIPR